MASKPEAGKSGENPLLTACRFGRFQFVESLLAGGEADISATDDNGLQAIHISSSRYDYKTMQLLLKHGADVNAADNEGCTPLAHICRNLFRRREFQKEIDSFTGDLEYLFAKYCKIVATDSSVVECSFDGVIKCACLLLQNGALTDKASHTKQTPLHYACALSSNESLVKSLIDRGAALNPKDNKGMTPLMMANHPNVIELLIKHGAYSEATNLLGQTALWVMSSQGNVAAVTSLINNRGNINTQDSIGATPLWVACQNGHPSIITLLLKNGAKLATPCKKGSTPIIIASECGQVDSLVALLSETGNDVVNLTTAVGDTAMHMAALNGHVKCMELLLSHGGNLNAQRLDGMTPLMTASKNGKVSSSVYLLEKSANKELSDTDGRTAVSISCIYGKLACLNNLIAAGARVNTTDNYGATPLLHACRWKHAPCVSALLKHGADPEVEDNEGYCALDHAIDNNDDTCITLLANAEISESLRPSEHVSMNLHSIEQSVVNMSDTSGFTDTLVDFFEEVQKGPPGMLPFDTQHSTNVQHSASLTGKESNMSDILSHTLLSKRRVGFQGDANGAVSTLAKEQHQTYTETTNNACIDMANLRVNEPDKSGKTPLHNACKAGNYEMVASLIGLDRNIDVNIPDKKGRRAIHYASALCHLKCIELLIRTNADVNVPDPDGLSPLNLVCRHLPQITKKETPIDKLSKKASTEFHSVEQCVQILLEAGSDPDLADNDGLAPIHNACARINGLNMSKLLLRYNADVNAATAKDHTPLLIANEGKLHDLLSLFLMSGANVNQFGDKHGPVLYFACVSNNTEAVQKLLESGADVNLAKRGHGQTPLISACEDGYLECVQLLIKYQSDLELIHRGATALYMACQNGHALCADALLHAGAEVNFAADTGWTSLIVAARQGHQSCVLVLLRYAAKVNLTDTNGIAPVHVASLSNKNDCLQTLLRAGAKHDLKTKDGQTALMLAANVGSLECMKVLIKFKCDPDFRCERGGTALYAACEGGQVQSAELLLKAGADPNIPRNNGTSPLIHAVENDHIGCVNLLINNSVDVNKRGASSSTAVYMACQKGHLKCLEALVLAGADINLSRDDGVTPLMSACVNGQIECVKYLLQNRVQMDKTTTKYAGRTALALSINQDGNIECIKVLIIAGSNVNKRDSDGCTPLFLACKRGMVEIVKLLIQTGADTGITNNNGVDPLHIAIERNHERCANILLGEVEPCPAEDKEEMLDWKELMETKYDDTYVDMVKELPIPKQAVDIMPIADVAKRPDPAASNKPTKKETPRIKVHGANAKTQQPKLPRSDPSGSRHPTDLAGNSHPYIEGIHSPEIALAIIENLELNSAYFNTQYNMCFCCDCHAKKGDKPFYMRGIPPKRYALPIGWYKFGLRTKPQAEAEDVFRTWHMAFHGTTVSNVQRILETGDLLLPGDNTPRGEVLRIPPNHFDPSNDKMPPPKGHDVVRFYLSPSIRYSGREVYSPRHKWTDRATGKIYIAHVAFQVRIKPGTYDVHPQTIGATETIDPLFTNSELEWSTKERGVVILVGLLVKVYPEGPTEKNDHPMAEHEMQDNSDNTQQGCMLMDYIYKNEKGHQVVLKRGEHLLIIGKNAENLLIMHERVPEMFYIPASFVKAV